MLSRSDQMDRKGDSGMPDRKQNDVLQNILEELQALKKGQINLKNQLSDLNEKVAKLTVGQSEIAGHLKEVDQLSDLNQKVAKLTVGQSEIAGQLKEVLVKIPELTAQASMGEVGNGVANSCQSHLPKFAGGNTTSKARPWPGVAQPVVTSTGIYEPQNLGSMQNGVTQGTMSYVQSIQTGVRLLFPSWTDNAPSTSCCTSRHSPSSGGYHSMSSPPTSTSTSSSHGSLISHCRESESQGTVAIKGSREVSVASSQSRLAINREVLQMAYCLWETLDTSEPIVFRMQVDTMTSSATRSMRVLIDENGNISSASSDRGIANLRPDHQIRAISQHSGHHGTANGVIPHIHRSPSGRNLSDQHICEISKMIGRRWKNIGILCLEFTREELGCIEENYSKVEERICEMLSIWNRRHGHNGGTIQKLLDVLVGSEDVDLGVPDFLRDLLEGC